MNNKLGSRGSGGNRAAAATASQQLAAINLNPRFLPPHLLQAAPLQLHQVQQQQTGGNGGGNKQAAATAAAISAAAAKQKIGGGHHPHAHAQPVSLTIVTPGGMGPGGMGRAAVAGQQTLLLQPQANLGLTQNNIAGAAGDATTPTGEQPQLLS